MSTCNPSKPVDVLKPMHDDDGCEGVDCQMCADSGLMTVMNAQCKPEVWPCVCERGKAHPWNQT